MQNKGLTLMELVIVVAILGGLSVAISRIFFSSLGGTKHTQNIISIRQAGDSALLNITKRLRNARTITSSCTNNMNSITFASRDPATKDLTSSGTISTTISCSDTSVTPNINRILIDVDGVASFATPANMEVNDCRFDCDATRVGAPPIVNIIFKLTEINSGADLDFTSTVTMRNF